MNVLGSLTNRIFLASAALAVLSIGFAVYFVSRTTTREAEAGLQRGLIEAGALVSAPSARISGTSSSRAHLSVSGSKSSSAVAPGSASPKGTCLPSSSTGE